MTILPGAVRIKSGINHRPKKTPKISGVPHPIIVRPSKSKVKANRSVPKKYQGIIQHDKVVTENDPNLKKQRFEKLTRSRAAKSNEKHTNISDKNISTVPLNIALTKRVINIQEVYALYIMHPELADIIGDESHLPFENSTFIFKDEFGSAVCVISTTCDNGKAKFEVFGGTGIKYEDLCRFAISLMNCKNIEYQEYSPVSKAERTRKSADPTRLSYKILHINPMTRHKVTKASQSRSDAHVPAHTVRGHFINGTTEKPLFGKPWGVGRFWVGPFVCGNPKYGLVIKDYHIDLSELNKALSITK